MLIIGMTGPIGHGKSTFAKAIKELEPSTEHLESSMVVAEIANALHYDLTDIPDPYDINSLNDWLKSLPAILLEHLHVRCTYGQIKLDADSIAQHPIEYQKLILHVENLKRTPDLAKHDINRNNKETYRPFLQWLGGYLIKKISQTIWYDEIVKRIHIAEHEGYKICIVGGLRFPTDAASIRRVGGIIIKVYRPAHLQNDMMDPTERERDNIDPDCVVMSNGTIKDIEKCAKIVLSDLLDGNLQTIYKTIPPKQD